MLHHPSGSGTSTESPAERLWTWTLAFYAGPGISPAFLHLQDGSGADVNILLFLLWQAAEGHAPLEPPDFAALDASIAAWRTEVVAPLRFLRRMLKGQGEDDVRTPIAAAELASERSSQKRLVAALAPRLQTAAPAHETAAQSLQAYAAFIGASFPAEPVAVLLDALK